MKTKLEKLINAIGKYVRLVNNASEQMEGSFQLQVHGALEHCEDQEDEWLVRISEDPRGHGCNVVSFGMKDVLDVENCPSGIVNICVK